MRDWSAAHVMLLRMKEHIYLISLMCWGGCVCGGFAVARDLPHRGANHEGRELAALFQAYHIYARQRVAQSSRRVLRQFDPVVDFESVSARDFDRTLGAASGSDRGARG